MKSVQFRILAPACHGLAQNRGLQLTMNRDLTLVIAARFVSRAGGAAAFFVGTWGVAAYVFKATAAQLAWMSAGNAVAGIAGTLVAGVLVDRVGPRTVLIAAELLTVPAVIAMSFAPTFPLFVLCSMGFSLVGVPTFTAGAAFAPFLVSGKEQLERANALIEAAGSAGFVLGPAVGALVSQAFGVRAVFWVMAAAALAAVAFAWFVRIEQAPKPAVGRHPLAELRAGLRVSYTTPSLRYFILLGSLGWFGFGAFAALEPLFYRDAVGVGVEWIGYMNTVFGAGLVTGAWLLPRLPGRVVSARGAALLVALMGIGAVGYVGTTSLWLIAIGAALWGTVIGAADPLLRTLIHLDSPHEYVGRVVGTAQYHRSLGELVPLALAPGLAALFGVQPVMIAGGVVVCAVALASWGVAMRLDRVRDEAAGPPVPEPAAA